MIYSLGKGIYMENKKRYQVFLWLWLGRLVTAIGSGVSSFSLSIFIYDQTGLATNSSLILLVTFLPDLVLSVPAGVLADRFDRRKLMILGDSLSAIGLLVLCFLINRLGVGAGTIFLCMGVSSVFTSLIDPSYKATVSELLDKKDFTRANGLVQLASSSKFLISPILAGFIMKYSGVKTALLVDILTIVPTTIIVLLVGKKMEAITSFPGKQDGFSKLSFSKEIHEAAKKIKDSPGITTICLVSFFITFSLGGLQTLLTPIILSFTTSDILGLITSISAGGMLVSSFILGLVPIRKEFQKILSLSLMLAGINMVFVGLTESEIMITFLGFFFFFTLPFANVCMDYLVRSNIDKAYEGRIWALIGFISQTGYIFAYAIIGVLADQVFAPLLMEKGPLSRSLGRFFGVGEGRGMGLLVSILGLLIVLYAFFIRKSQNIKQLEGDHGFCLSKD